MGIILPEDVLGAIALLDDPFEGPRLRQRLHFGPARSYRLLWEGRFYDSKPVVGIAHGLRRGGAYLSSRDFIGAASGAAQILTRLGFYVDYKWLHAISQLRVDRTHGRPAAYQYVVLLWAIARARSGVPRMAQFNDVREELADLSHRSRSPRRRLTLSCHGLRLTGQNCGRATHRTITGGKEGG
jgi:hypothetical protein